MPFESYYQFYVHINKNLSLKLSYNPFSDKYVNKKEIVQFYIFLITNFTARNVIQECNLVEVKKILVTWYFFTPSAKSSTLSRYCIFKIIFPIACDYFFHRYDFNYAEMIEYQYIQGAKQ